MSYRHSVYIFIEFEHVPNWLWSGLKRQNTENMKIFGKISGNYFLEFFFLFFLGILRTSEKLRTFYVKMEFSRSKGTFGKLTATAFVRSGNRLTPPLFSLLRTWRITYREKSRETSENDSKKHTLGGTRYFRFKKFHKKIFEKLKKTRKIDADWKIRESGNFGSFKFRENAVGCWSRLEKIHEKYEGKNFSRKITPKIELWPYCH